MEALLARMTFVLLPGNNLSVRRDSCSLRRMEEKPIDG